jgi:hypothetical protein
MSLFAVSVRKTLGLIGATLYSLTDNNSAEGYVDALGALWTRDYQSQPAQTWTPITPSGTAFASQSPVVTFRALRFDAAGAVTFTNQAGTSITRTVAAGEVWNASSNAITAIAAYTGGLDGLG